MRLLGADGQFETGLVVLLDADAGGVHIVDERDQYVATERVQPLRDAWIETGHPNASVGQVGRGERPSELAEETSADGLPAACGQLGGQVFPGGTPSRIAGASDGGTETAARVGVPTPTIDRT